MKQKTTRPELLIVPSVLKTDGFGPGNHQLRVAAEFGRFVVPENRSNPHSNAIELAFVRLPSTAPHPGPPLVFLQGGPGASGIDGLRWSLPWFMALREVGDVIALDQRGTGLSHPCLDCLDTWALPLDQPGSRDEVLRLAREGVRRCVAFWRGQGVDLSGYTTEESADDVDALREALGYEQIHLYGASYGSHLALATIKRHEAHIARAVIALVEGPDHTLKLPGNVQKHLEHLQALVQTDSRLRAAIPNLLELMRTVLERLTVSPVTVEVRDEKSGKLVQVCLGSFDLAWVTANGLGSRPFLAHLPARYHAMVRGDFSWVAGEVLELRRSWIGNAMSYVMDCASGASAERAQRIQMEAPETLLGTIMDFPFPDICDACGTPDLGPAFRAPITSEVPALFLSGSLDGRTPPSNAEEVRAGFSHSHHLIVENGAHGDETLEAPGVSEAILTFLKGEPVSRTHASLPFAFIPVAERDV